jgi:hypothetical protein
MYTGPRQAVRWNCGVRKPAAPKFTPSDCQIQTVFPCDNSTLEFNPTSFVLQNRRTVHADPKKVGFETDHTREQTALLGQLYSRNKISKTFSLYDESGA